MKKFAAQFMILLVISQIGAAWTVFSTAIWIHKQNKHCRLIDQSRWEQFVLSKHEFESKLLEDDEIEIEGRLYDIVTIEELHGLISVTAVADQAENKMKRTLGGLQKEENGWSEVAKLAQSFSMAVFHPEQILRLVLPSFTNSSLLFNYPNKKFEAGFPGKPEQPPTI